MTSTVKETFSSTNAWANRAGVVVGYQPEDTMKSYLFNQNNRHCLTVNGDELLTLFKLKHNELEKALEFLSSDSETESSSMTKITVKDITSLAGSLSDVEKSKENKIRDASVKQNTDFDNDSTFANVSNDFDDNLVDIDASDDAVCVAVSKPFEQIIEEQLKLEDMKKSSRASRKASLDNNHISPKPKFMFLKKNQGKSAWSCNMRSNSNVSNRHQSKKDNIKMRSHSSDPNPSCCISETTISMTNKTNNVSSKKMSVSDVPKKCQLSPSNPIDKSQKNNQKTVHFALSCDDGELALAAAKEHKFPTTEQISFCPPIDSKQFSVLQTCHDTNITADKELVEFELLEQIANVSISSTASSIARFDEETLREKLRDKVQNMPPPETETYSQKKYFGYLKSGEKRKVQDEKEERISIVLNEEAYDYDEGEDEDNTSVISVPSTKQSEYQGDTSLPSSKNNNQCYLSRKISKQDDRQRTIQEHIDDNNYTSGGGYGGDGNDWSDDSPFHINENTVKDLPTFSNQNDQTYSNKINNNIKWAFTDPFATCVNYSDEYGDNDDDRGSKLNDATDTYKIRSQIADNITGGIFPTISVNKTQVNPDENVDVQSAKLKHWVQLLEKEIKKFNTENAELAKMKKEREEGLKRLEDEMMAFRKYRDEENQKFEEYKQNEMKKLKKDRKIFDEYQEAMKNMPNKKDRQEIERLKTENELLKDEIAGKENRWQASNTRLKQRIDQLESEKAEFQSRIHSLEQKRLQLQAQLISGTGGKARTEANITKPKPTVTSVSQAVSQKHTNIPILSTKDDSTNNNNKYVASNRTSNLNRKPSLKSSSNKLSKTTNSLPSKNPNPSATEYPAADLRGSAASDYYTGEEESGSQELNNNDFIDKPLLGLHISVPASNPQTPSTRFATSVFKVNRSNDTIKDDIRHPDGILERMYMNGDVDVFYPNGSLKQISSDGKSIVVHLYNGDVKQVTPDGRVIYYYAQDESTQTTYLNGKEEILYKNGQKEIIHTSGIKEIHFPDQSIKILHPDSREENILPNGFVIRLNTSGDKEILMPNGQREIHSNGIKKRIYPDGTTKTVFPNGRQETFYASGRMRVKDKNGNLILDQYVERSAPIPVSE